MLLFRVFRARFSFYLRSLFRLVGLRVEDSRPRQDLKSRPSAETMQELPPAQAAGVARRELCLCIASSQQKHYCTLRHASQTYLMHPLRAVKKLKSTFPEKKKLSLARSVFVVHQELPRAKLWP